MATAARIIPTQNKKLPIANQKMTNLKSILMTTLLSVLLLGTASCDNHLVYEDEGDCTPKVQFVFKKHRHALQAVPGRETDAFYSTVGTVHLFIYEAETGKLVFDKAEKTEDLKSASELGLGSSDDKCFMDVDIKPGNYRFVAWCGLDDTDNNNAFYLNEGNTDTRYDECRVKTSASTGHPLNSEKYESLYHGITKAEVSVSRDGQVIPVRLTKNNNDIAVWVQHANKTFNEGDYEVVYTDANGTMKFEDNAVNSAKALEYRAHTTSILTSSTEYNGSEMETGALVAHISTSRLMEANQKDARLEVRDKEGKTVFSIPFIKYVLQLQTVTNDNQYYLDCEDTYNCSFYLTGDDGLWMPARIIINNWVVVPSQNDTI